MTRRCWLDRAARHRHRHAIEQASRRWRGGRRGDSARARRKILISTQVVTAFDGFKHVVRYDDGDAELLNLTGPGREEKFELIIDLTKAPLSKEPAPRDPRTRVKTEPAPPRPPPAATPRQQAAAAKAAAYAKQRADEIARVGIDPRTANGLETLVEEAGLGGGKGAVPRVLALERDAKDDADEEKGDEFSGMNTKQLKEAMKARGVGRGAYDTPADFRRKLRAHKAEKPVRPARVKAESSEDEEEEEWDARPPIHPRKGGRSPPWRKEGVTKSTRKPEGKPRHPHRPSRFHGVSWVAARGYWQARLQGGAGYLGTFHDDEEAAKAVNAEIKRRGLEHCCRLNPVGPDGRVIPKVAGEKRSLGRVYHRRAPTPPPPRPPAGGAQTPRQQAAATKATAAAKARKREISRVGIDPRAAPKVMAKKPRSFHLPG